MRRTNDSPQLRRFRLKLTLVFSYGTLLALETNTMKTMILMMMKVVKKRKSITMNNRSFSR